MKLIKDNATVSSVDGTGMRVVDLEGNGDYYALMSALVSYLDLSYGVVQRAATRLGCYNQVKGTYCVPSRMLHALCCELRKRYPKKTKVQELWAASAPSTEELIAKELAAKEGAREEQERQLKSVERKVTPQEPVRPCACQSQMDVEPPHSGDEGEGEEAGFYTVLPKELKAWTFDAMKASDAGGFTLLYRWVAESSSSTLQELWGNYVYELHKLDELYPKLPLRLLLMAPKRGERPGKLKLVTYSGNLNKYGYKEQE